MLPPALVWNTNEVLGLVPRPQRNQDLFAMLFEARVGSPFETLIVQRANVDLEDESSSSSKLITHVITLFRTRVSHINGTQTSAYFWFTQIYLAFVVELWDVLDNPVALKALADGTKHMICLFCRNKFFSLHSNPNGYVGEVASRQHNHKKIHGAARAVLQGGKFTLV